MLFLDNRPLFSQPSQSKNINDKFFEIKYEELLKQKNIIRLSQIASKVEYIQLETNNECLLSSQARYFFVDSLIFVDNMDHILKFNSHGKFLTKIGRPGRGPGEIQTIADISIIPSKRQIAVQLLESRKLVYFSFDGKFIKNESHPYRGLVKKLDDGNSLIWDGGPIKWTKFTFLLTNEKEDTLSVIPNYKTIINKSNIAVSPAYSFIERFYYFDKRLFFKDDFNDTVYYMNAGKIQPAYSINLGKYKLPESLRPESLEPSNIKLFYQKASNFYYCCVLETSNKIFLVSHNYYRDIPKYILYDKPSHLGNLMNNNENISTGIVNDWDGGLDFWPTGNITDNKIFMPINMMDLKKEFEKSKSAKNSIKFPDRQKDLSKILSNSDNTDNPIIMIVTLKAKN